jgi:rubrerythrin
MAEQKSTEYPKWISHPVEGDKIVNSEDEEIEHVKRGYYGRSTKLSQIQFLKNKRDLLIKDVEVIDSEIEILERQAKEEAMKRAKAKEEMAAQLKREAADIHEQFKEVLTDPPNPDDLTCKVCGKVCKNKIGYSAHMVTHSGKE